MTNIQFNTSITDVTKTIAWGIIVPFIIFQTSGLPWLFAYLVVSALYFNFVNPIGSGITGMVITIEAMALTGFYAVLVVVLFLGAVSAAIGG